MVMAMVANRQPKGNNAMVVMMAIVPAIVIIMMATDWTRGAKREQWSWMGTHGEPLDQNQL